jgi:hypothetical protein
MRCYTGSVEKIVQAALTPEQLAATMASGGFAYCEDQTNHVHYFLVQYEPSTLEDDYIREKLAEAQASIDRGDVADWDVDELKRECREAFAKKSRQ